MSAFKSRVATTSSQHKLAHLGDPSFCVRDGRVEGDRETDYLKEQVDRVIAPGDMNHLVGDRGRQDVRRRFRPQKLFGQDDNGQQPYRPSRAPSTSLEKRTLTLAVGDQVAAFAAIAARMLAGNSHRLSHGDVSRRDVEAERLRKSPRG